MLNGGSETVKLSEQQLKQLQQLLGPYFNKLQALEMQSNSVREVINNIAGAYLTGLGIPSEMNIDLVTGDLTPSKVAQIDG